MEPRKEYPKKYMKPSKPRQVNFGESPAAKILAEKLGKEGMGIIRKRFAKVLASFGAKKNLLIPVFNKNAADFRYFLRLCFIQHRAQLKQVAETSKARYPQAPEIAEFADATLKAHYNDTLRAFSIFPEHKSVKKKVAQGAFVYLTLGEPLPQLTDMEGKPLKPGYVHDPKDDIEA